MTQYLDNDGEPITAGADVKVPDGYSILKSKGPAAPKKEPKPLKEVKAKALALKPSVVTPTMVQPAAVDFTSNPQNEGLYEMFGRIGSGDAVGHIKIPFSKVQSYLDAGGTFAGNTGAQERFAKDKAVVGKKPSFLGTVDERITKALQPVPEDPGKPQTFSNLDRAAGRAIYGAPKYLVELAKQIKTDHDTGSMEAMKMIDPGQIPKGLYDQWKADWATGDHKLAMDNLLGSIVGLGVVGAATHGITKSLVPEKTSPAPEKTSEVEHVAPSVEEPKPVQEAHANAQSDNVTSNEEVVLTKPIRAYHGTEKTFEGPPRTEGLGAHFSPSREMAETFTNEEGNKARVIEAEIGIKNPLRIEDYGGSHSAADGVIKDFVKQGVLPDSFLENVDDGNLYKRSEEILGPIGDLYGPELAAKRSEAWNKANTEALEKVKVYLKSKGFDGLVYDNKAEGHGDSYVAFDPEQISVSKGEATNPSNTKGPLQKPIHEMTPDEVKTALDEAKNRDKQDVIDIFGEEDARRYQKLQSAANNPWDMKKADAAASELQDMEGKLTPEQQNFLYGIGDTRHSVEDLKEYHDAYHNLDVSSPEALGNSLKWAVSQVGDPTRAPETMTPKERMRLAQLRYGYEDAVKNGYDPMQVMRSAVHSAAERFSDPEDARMMLQNVVKALHIDERERSTQKALPEAKTEDEIDNMSDEEFQEYAKRKKEERERREAEGETWGDQEWNDSKAPVMQHEADDITYQSKDTGNGIEVRAFKDGKKIAEVSIAEEEPKVAFTSGIMVPKSLRGKGIARKVYQQIPSIAKAYGIEKVVGEGVQSKGGVGLWKSLEKSGLAKPMEAFNQTRLGMTTEESPDVHKAGTKSLRSMSGPKEDIDSPEEEQDQTIPDAGEKEPPTSLDENTNTEGDADNAAPIEEQKEQAGVGTTGSTPNAILPIGGGTVLASAPVQNIPVARAQASVSHTVNRSVSVPLETAMGVTPVMTKQILPLAQVKAMAAGLNPQRAPKSVREVMEEAIKRSPNKIVP